MKKLIFILSGIFLLTITSCEKEEIRPNTGDNQLENELFINLGDKRDRPDISKSNSPNIGDKDDAVSDSTFTITDPNRDEDDDRKIKRK